MYFFLSLKRAGNHTSDSLGVALLRERSLFTENYWYWIGVGALLGYTIIFNLLFTVFLAYLNRKLSPPFFLSTPKRHINILLILVITLL